MVEWPGTPALHIVHQIINDMLVSNMQSNVFVAILTMIMPYTDLLLKAIAAHHAVVTLLKYVAVAGD